MNSVDIQDGGSCSKEWHEAQNEEVLHDPKKELGFDVTKYRNENDNMRKRSKEGVVREVRTEEEEGGKEIKMKMVREVGR